MHYKYIIIEDLPKVAENLKHIVTTYENYYFKGLALNLEQALELITKQKPDLIFLDIELGSESGFNLFPLLKIQKLPIPFTIVTSRVINYAIDSIKIDAIDFVDKPFTVTKIETALKRFEEKYKQNNKQIVLKNRDGKQFIDTDKVYFIQAQGASSCIYTIDNIEYKFSKDLKEILEILPSNFERIHKSYIINNDYKCSLKSQTIHLKKLSLINPLKAITIVWNSGIKVSDKF